MPHPDVELCRPIRHGAKGPDVVAVKRALSRAGYMQWGAFTPTWGDFAVKAVQAFQEAHDLERTGNYGEKTHAALLAAHRKSHANEWAWDSYSARIVQDFCKEFNAAPEDRIRRAIAATAYYWSCKRNQIHYSQIRPFQLVEPPDIPARIDCSGFVTLCHKAGGAVNPNRRQWDGLGYTGTLLGGGRRCTDVKELKPGDCVFYGFTKLPKAGFPLNSPTHVALYVGGGYVITQGNEDGPEHVLFNYWSQVNCYMTYNVV